MDPTAYCEMQEIEDSHWWFVARRQILSALIEQSCKPNLKILEVGCGTGGNLLMLSKLGELKAFEMDPSALAMATKKEVKDVVLTLGKCPDQMPYPGERFDLIFLFDVLEHIKNDRATLMKLKNYLTPQGKIILTVPACQWLFGPHDQFLQHHRRYSRSALIRLIKDSGLKVQRTSYFNSILFPLILISRLFDRFIFSDRQIKAMKPSKTTNAVLRQIFAFERYLLPSCNLPIGLSLVCVLSL